MRVGSLFSGIGGIELGLERAGCFEAAWFVENDIHAQAILRKHWPTAQIYDDVTTVDFSAVPPIDVLTGGFPCQDISNAGKRAGITGSRSGLWKHYLRAISILRPRYVIAENVAALIDRGLDTVLCDLAAIGYDAEWHCLPAAAVGAPHRRDRIFILAYPNSSRHLHREPQEQPAEDREHAQRELEPSGADVAYSYGGNVEALRESGTEQGIYGQHSAGSSESGSGSLAAGWWAVEPSLGRVADGVPYWTHRIKRLGNAVVPQVAQAVGEAIKKAER